MIEIKRIKELYPKAVIYFNNYIGFPEAIISGLSFHKFIKYFDDLGLFIGITCDADGLFWIPEICSIPLQVCKSRESAQDLAIEECFKMIEDMKNFEIA